MRVLPRRTFALSLFMLLAVGCRGKVNFEPTYQQRRATYQRLMGEADSQRRVTMGKELAEFDAERASLRGAKDESAQMNRLVSRMWVRIMEHDQVIMEANTSRAMSLLRANGLVGRFDGPRTARIEISPNGDLKYVYLQSTSKGTTSVKTGRILRATPTVITYRVPHPDEREQQLILAGPPTTVDGKLTVVVGSVSYAKAL